DAGLEKLENSTLRERVYASLRQEILSSRLPPGAELNEVAVAESLGVSRGPVREALGRLAAEGLVTFRPRRSAFVSTLSAEEFLEAYQVREALERLAVRLATPRLDADDVRRLERLIAEQAECVERDDADGFFEANGSFHELLVALSGNAKLQELYRHLIAQMTRYRTRSLALRGTLGESVAEHRRILEAAEAGDAELAAHVLGEHIQVPQRRLEAALRDGTAVLAT
ncbi:MAG: GntR family transcriptional regulator, partial [Gaiellales bacterium]